MVISRSVLLKMKSVSGKFVEKIETQIMCSVTFFFRKSCRLWDNVEKYCRAGQTTDNKIAHAPFMPDVCGYKYTHSEYVILIAFPLQQWLHKRVLCFVISTLYCPSCSDLTIPETVQKYSVKTLCNKQLNISFSEVRRKGTSILLIALKICQSAWRVKLFTENS